MTDTDRDRFNRNCHQCSLRIQGGRYAGCMMKQNDPAQLVELKPTMQSKETNSMESSRTSPYLLIFVAWLSGTLLFEISALEDLGSQSTRQQANLQAGAQQIGTQRDRRLSVARNMVARPSRVLTAGSLARTPGTPTIELASHQVDLPARGSDRLEIQRTVAQIHSGSRHCPANPVASKRGQTPIVRSTLRAVPAIGV